MQPHTIWRLAGAAGAAGLALMAIAATIATSAHPEKPVWMHNPTMYLAYGLLAIAVLLGAKALGILARLWAILCTAVAFLPVPTFSWTAPKRRIQRRKQSEFVQARVLAEKVTALEKAAALQRAERAIVAAAAGTASQQVYANSTKARAQQQARNLRQEGSALQEELWRLVRDTRRADTSPSAFGGIPLSSTLTGRIKDWNTRLTAFVDPHLTTKEQAEVATFPKLLPLAAIGFCSDPAIKAIEAMFATNLAVLARVERNL